MATIQVTEKNFDEVAESDIILFDFWASWCGPCRTFGPIFEEASKRHPDVVFGKIDTEAEPALAREFQVRAIPTLVAVRDGVILGTHSGVLTGKELDDVVQRAKELDMEKLHAQADKEEAKAEKKKKKKRFLFF